jgi:enoyl-CoA hydratase/carnithine racemase
MSLIKYEKRDKIAYISYNRPEKMNSLSPEMLNELAGVWLEFREDDDLWVAILSGEGKAFCAGADFSGFGAFDSYPLLKDPMPTTPVNSSPAWLGSPNRYGITKPIIGAIHGYALGGGMWLALETDIRVATADALFGMPEPKFGNATKVAIQFLYQVSPAIAHELLYLGDRISAQRAYEVGLINKVVANRDEAMSTAQEIADKLCQNGPLAVRAMKESIMRWRNWIFQGQFTFMEYICGPSWKSKDCEEGRKAFLEKRKPVWKAE